MGSESINHADAGHPKTQTAIFESVAQEVMSAPLAVDSVFREAQCLAPLGSVHK